MAARAGKQYLDGLNDDRCVWVADKQVDVLKHSRFVGSLSGITGYFGWQHLYANDCLLRDQVGGEVMSGSLVVPRHARDLEVRHRCFDRLAKYSCGMLGRTPERRKMRCRD